MARGWSPVGWYSLFTRNPLRVEFSMQKPRDLSWIVKRRASETYDLIVPRTPTFSRSILPRRSPHFPARRNVSYRHNRPYAVRKSTHPPQIARPTTRSGVAQPAHDIG